MRRAATMLAAAAAAAGCGGGGAETVTVEVEPPPATTVTVTRTETAPEEDILAFLPEGWSLCTNLDAGYAIGYPGGWHTTHLEPEQACQLFHPEPFEIERDTEFPLTALTVVQTEEPFERVLDGFIDPMFARVALREDAHVAGFPAARIEIEATGEGLYEAGTRQYGYVVDRDGTAFYVLASAPPGEERYEQFGQVADQAVETVRFF